MSGEGTLTMRPLSETSSDRAYGVDFTTADTVKIAQKGISRELAVAVMDKQISRVADKEDSDLAAALIYARKNLLAPIHAQSFVL